MALVFSIGHVFLALYWMFLSERSYFFRTANVLAKKCASSIGGWLAFGADVTAVERPPLGAAGTALGCVSSSFITMGLCRGCCAGGCPFTFAFGSDSRWHGIAVLCGQEHERDAVSFVSVESALRLGLGGGLHFWGTSGGIGM